LDGQLDISIFRKTMRFSPQIRRNPETPARIGTYPGNSGPRSVSGPSIPVFARLFAAVLPGTIGDVRMTC